MNLRTSAHQIPYLSLMLITGNQALSRRSGHTTADGVAGTGCGPRSHRGYSRALR
jgi:hypothetical protein